MSTLFPYGVRRQVTGDEPAIIDLLQRTVGETVASRKTAEFWRWKHSESPFGASYSICAWDDSQNELAGLRTLMWWSFRAPDGSLRRAARAVDTATHPAHQRKGIFSRLTRAAIEDLREEGAAFIFNTPNHQSLPGYLKMGWSEVTRWPIFIRPVSWLELGRTYFAKWRKGDGGERAPDDCLGGLMAWTDFRAEHGRKMDEVVSRHERLRTQVGYRTERTPAFLDWRYGRHPDIDYGVHAVTDGEGLRGVVVARSVRSIRGLSALVIVELFLRDPTSREGAFVLKSLRRTTSCDYLVAHFAPRTIERGAIRRSGFTRAPGRGYTFAARPLTEVPDELTRPNAWDLTLCELEIF